MTTVLVTGSSGFLGGAVADRLAKQGIRTIGLDLVPRSGPTFETIADDLGDRQRIAKHLTAHRVTHVIHCGGISSPRLASAEAIMAQNVGASLNLFLACRDVGVRRCVYASSVAVLGAFEGVATATTALNPRNPYAFSKAAAEQIIGGLRHSGSTSFCILRFAGIYGPGRRTGILPNDLAAAAANGQHVRIAAGGKTSYVYIDDAAQAAVSACFATHLTDRPYYIAHPERVSAAELAHAVRAVSPTFTFDLHLDDSAVALGSLDTLPTQRDLQFRPQIDYRNGINLMYHAIASLLESENSHER